jgi:hypothetical protein
MTGDINGRTMGECFYSCRTSYSSIYKLKAAHLPIIKPTESLLNKWLKPHIMR